ncbi:MAG: hypothetical protein JWQ55_6469, partial [Rhodopila sp.]|nr:hypothetical protein [Rhodopila sp.]
SGCIMTSAVGGDFLTGVVPMLRRIPRTFGDDTPRVSYGLFNAPKRIARARAPQP